MLQRLHRLPSLRRCSSTSAQTAAFVRRLGGPTLRFGPWRVSEVGFGARRSGLERKTCQDKGGGWKTCGYKTHEDPKPWTQTPGLTGLLNKTNPYPVHFSILSMDHIVNFQHFLVCLVHAQKAAATPVKLKSEACRGLAKEGLSEKSTVPYYVVPVGRVGGLPSPMSSWK